MDPDENLKEQKELAEQIIGDRSFTVDAVDAHRLAELVLALDEWVSKGGFLPQAWQNKKT